MRHGNKPQGRLEKKAKEWGNARGYIGLCGGWIYLEKGQKPVCHGWKKFYELHQEEIDAWLNGSKPKKHKNRPHDVCPHCKRSFDRSGFHRHKRVCGLLPDGKTLDEMLKKDPTLSVYAIAERYKVSVIIAYDKIVQTTGWTKKQLVARGRKARKVEKNTMAMNTERRRGMVREGLSFCLFCEVANKHVICTSCQDTLERLGAKKEVPDEWAHIIILTAKQGTLPAKYVKLFRRIIKKKRIVR
jgi:hypothetical protein